MKPWKAELLLLLVTLLWGGTFMFTKVGLDFTTPFFYLAMRMLIATIFVLIIFGRYLSGINKKTIINGIILGSFYSGGFLLQTSGLNLTIVTKSAFITGMAVVFTPIVYWLITRRKIKIWQKLGVLITFTGLWIFTSPTDIDKINPGDVLTLLSTLFWAFYITYIDILTKNNEESMNITVQLVIIQFLCVFLSAIVFFFIFEFNEFRFIPDPLLLISLAANGIVASVITTFVHTRYQRYTTPVKAALIFSLEPVFAGLVAIAVISEILTGFEYFGAAILLTGVLLSELGEPITKTLWNKKKPVKII